MHNINLKKIWMGITLIAHFTYSQDVKPNILLIITDQQQAEAISATGNTDVKTPNIDRLAKNGVLFDRTYVTFPLCTPSRTSIFTGKMPHYLGVESNENGDNIMAEKDKKNGLGNILKAAGYDCAYGGKWHAHEASISPGNGFDKISDFGDIPLAENCINYLKEQKNKKKPFFLVASFDNPHNICEWARNQPLPYGNVPIPEDAILPELPKNFAKSKTFPEALQIEQTASKRIYPTKNYTERDWRKYRYAYYHLVEQVDTEIGKIIDAIYNLGLDENTIIIFTSDHGDGNASHQWNQKTALFEESVKVPLIISSKNIKNKGERDRYTLISNGLDLYPTICELAGVSLPKGLLGKSLKPLLFTENYDRKREKIVIETKFAGKYAYNTRGRAVVGKKYKYILYSWGKNREQFFDLENDPYEMQNLANSKTHLEKLNEFRHYLYQWCKENNDNIFLRKLILPDNSKLSSSDLFDKPY